MFLKLWLIFFVLTSSELEPELPSFRALVTLSSINHLILSVIAV